jgi:hypothetical protein
MLAISKRSPADRKHRLWFFETPSLWDRLDGTARRLARRADASS